MNALNVHSSPVVSVQFGHLLLMKLRLRLLLRGKYAAVLWPINGPIISANWVVRCLATSFGQLAGPSSLGFSLLLGLVSTPMPMHPLSPASLHLPFSHEATHNSSNSAEPSSYRIFDERNAFETARYGLRIDHCPNGQKPEISEQDGRVKLCQLDAECKPSFKCENIVGLTHFGKQMRFCCPTKISVCTLKPKLSTDVWSFPVGCHRPPLRIFYYFDADQLKCAKGRMAQCEELGENQFATESECRTKCETTACEIGESILLHNNSFDSPFLCSSDDDCPVGYNCRQDNIFRRSVCCGFLNFEPCPIGFRSFVIPFTGRAKSCKDSVTRDECPADYVCTQNGISKEHFCCTVEKGVCPQGHQAYIHPLTDGTIKCNLQSFDTTTSCPPGYVCLEAVFGSIWGFCCAQAMTGAFRYCSVGQLNHCNCPSPRFCCPEGSYPQINLITKQPQRCELTQQPSVCASEFECETDEATHLGFCCSIRKHEKVKPTPEPMPRKRTRTMPTQNTTMSTTIMATIWTKNSATKTTKKVMGTPNLMGFMALSTEAGTERPPKGEGRPRKRGKGKRRKSRKRGRQRESGRENGGNDSSSSSSSSTSSSSSSSYDGDEQSEKADLMELSTKLDRFISGVRNRKAKLTKGHSRGSGKRSRSKGHTKWGKSEKIGRIFGKREHGRRWTESEEEEEENGETESRNRMAKKREWEENGGEEEEEQGEPWKKQKSGASTAIPKCPHGFSAMNYPGTQWTYLECVMDEELKLRMKKRRGRKKVKKRKQNSRRKRRRKKRKGRRGKEWGEEGRGGEQSVKEAEDGNEQQQQKKPNGEEEEGREVEEGGGREERKDFKQGGETEEEKEREESEEREEEEEERDEEEGEEEEEEIKKLEEREEGEEEEEEGDEEGHQQTEHGHVLQRRSTVCPRGSLCLNARDDPFGRALCCVKKRKLARDYKLVDGEEDAQAEEWQKSGHLGTGGGAKAEQRLELDNSRGRNVAIDAAPATTEIVSLTLEESIDQACPRFVAGRICKPGFTDICVEEGFFCQYNKERKEFVCCTLEEKKQKDE